MKKFVVILMILLYNCVLYASENFYDVEYVRNYDGDTITVNINDVHPLLGDNINIRVRGIDTPEIRGKCQYEKDLAYEAKYFVENLLISSNKINLINAERGKYFRIVADVIIDGVNLKDFLLDKEYIKLYNGGTKSKWCKK